MTVLIGGKPAWRLTDQHTCPIPNAPPPVCSGTPHGPGITTPGGGGGTGVTLIGGKPAACIGRHRDGTRRPGAAATAEHHRCRRNDRPHRTGRRRRLPTRRHVNVSEASRAGAEAFECFQLRATGPGRGVFVSNETAEADAERYAALLRDGELAGRELTGLELAGIDGRGSNLQGSALLEVVLLERRCRAPIFRPRCSRIAICRARIFRARGRLGRESSSSTLRAMPSQRGTFDGAQFVECDLSASGSSRLVVGESRAENCVATEACLSWRHAHARGGWWIPACQGSSESRDVQGRLADSGAS